METYDTSDAGYPEEQPPGVAPDDAPSGDRKPAHEEAATPREAARDAPDNDDGTNTGAG